MRALALLVLSVLLTAPGCAFSSPRAPVKITSMNVRPNRITRAGGPANIHYALSDTNAVAFPTDEEAFAATFYAQGYKPIDKSFRRAISPPGMFLTIMGSLICPPMLIFHITQRTWRGWGPDEITLAFEKDPNFAPPVFDEPESVVVAPAPGASVAAPPALADPGPTHSNTTTPPVAEAPKPAPLPAPVVEAPKPAPPPPATVAPPVAAPPPAVVAPSAPAPLAAPATHFCAECGKAVEERAKFCRGCGTKQ